MPWTDSVRSVVDKGRDVGSQAARGARKQGRRARKELEAKRIQRKIRAQKTAIGEAVHAAIAAGRLTMDDPAVNAAVATIAELETELTTVRSQIADILEPEPEEDTFTPASGGGEAGS